jgi:Cu(I)/Ag(I) efflux system protein CusF
METIMFNKRRLVYGLLGAVLATTAASSLAQQPRMTPEQLAMNHVPAEAPSWVEGEVRRIDAESRKVTLRHGDIRNLDMPGMTMVFRVQDGIALDNVKVGDKVRFMAMSDNGQVVLTQLQPAN